MIEEIKTTNEKRNKMKYAFYCKKLRPDAKIPTKGSDGANAYDLYAVTDLSLIHIWIYMCLISSLQKGV